jgi:hypothetical protein
MAIGDYAELQAAIQGFLWNRADVAAQIPDFIRLAEAQMNRRLTCRQMERIDPDFTLYGEMVPLPDDFAGVKSFRVTSQANQAPLQYTSPEGLERLGNYGGPPSHYSIVGDQFAFFPFNGGTYTARLRYRQTIPSLSDAEPVNWLLQAHPDVYLYGALTQSAPWLHEDERLEVWAALFRAAIDDINSDGVRQATGATLHMGPSGGVI